MVDSPKSRTLLDDLELNLTDNEIDRLYKIVKEGKTKDVDNIINLITQRFSQLAPSATTNYQSGRASSADFNEQFADFFADLIILYLLADKINKLIATIDDKNKSDLDRLNNVLEGLREEIELKKELALEKSGFTEIIQENFKKQEHQADFIPSLYVDPQTETYLTKERTGIIDNNAECLYAAIENSIDNYDLSCSKTGQTATAFIEKANTYNKIANLEINTTEAKWDETLLVPERIDMQQDDHLFREYTDLKENAYSYIQNGALCKIKTTFDVPAPINSLFITPFTEYPFEIVKIIAFPAEENYELFHRENNYVKARDIGEVMEVLGPEEFNELQETLVINEPQMLNFSCVAQSDEAKIIEFAIRQQNFENTNYQIAKQDKLNIDIINDMFVDKKIETNRDAAQVQSIPELDYKNRNINWVLLENLIQKLAQNFDLNAGFIDNLVDALDKRVPNFNKDKISSYLQTSQDQEPAKFQENNRFKYQYGLQTLDFKFNNYRDNSVFISKLYEVNSNIKEVALDVTDSIVLYDNYFDTNYSIEYYISNIENPSTADWYPILPQSYQDICQDNGKIKIKEIAHFTLDENHNYTSNLRFEAAAEQPAVLKDADNNSVSFSFINNNTIVSETAAHLLQDSHRDAKKFTFEYYVAAHINPFIVNFEDVSERRQFVDEDGNTGELFESGTNENNSITLSNYPYIDYKTINTAQVIPHDMDIDSVLELYNPNLFEYDPNYNIQNEGYQPISIEMQGQAETYDVINNQEIIIDEVFYNDNFGIPYQFEYITDEEGNFVTKTKTRREQMVENNIVKPHFYNKTNYLSEEDVVLNEYSATDNPVFEYVHEGNKIYFNDSFTDRDSENIGQLRVYYSYLTEGIRVMALMRQKNPELNTTPLIHNYKIKQRDFDI